MPGRGSAVEFAPGHSSSDRRGVCTHGPGPRSLLWAFPMAVSLLCLPTSWTFFRHFRAHLAQVKRLILSQARASSVRQDGAWLFIMEYL